MSTSKKARISLAIGVLMVLSIVVFGSILFVGFSSVASNDVVLNTSDDEGMRVGEYLMSRNPEERIRRGDIEFVPTSSERVRRGSIELLPDYAPFFRRGPIEIQPDYNPYLGIRRPPVYLLPI